tara:strand:- start:5835 stop:6071 length:237 start_codon:yes stop_codon:yes gene_type:complete
MPPRKRLGTPVEVEAEEIPTRDGPTFQIHLPWTSKAWQVIGLLAGILALFWAGPFLLEGLFDVISSGLDRWDALLFGN